MVITSNYSPVRAANTPAPAPQPTPPQQQDQVNLGEGQADTSLLGYLKAHGEFFGATAGVAIGAGLAINNAAPGSTIFFHSLLGGIGGEIVGGLFTDKTESAPELPKALAYFKQNASTIGALAGIGVGLYLAQGAGALTGGTIFYNSLFGAIGGGVVGGIIENS